MIFYDFFLAYTMKHLQIILKIVIGVADEVYHET